MIIFVSKILVNDKLGGVMVNKREIRVLCMTLQSVWKIFINYVSAILKFIDICYFSKNESGHRGNHFLLFLPFLQIVTNQHLRHYRRNGNECVTPWVIKFNRTVRNNSLCYSFCIEKRRIVYVFLHKVLVLFCKQLSFMFRCSFVMLSSCLYYFSAIIVEP